MIDMYRGWSTIATLSLCFPHTRFACPAVILQDEEYRHTILDNPVTSDGKIGLDGLITAGMTHVYKHEGNDPELFHEPNEGCVEKNECAVDRDTEEAWAVYKALSNHHIISGTHSQLPDVVLWQDENACILTD